MESEKATIKMSAHEGNANVSCSFHVYRGGIQGGWEDHEINKNVTNEVSDLNFSNVIYINGLDVLPNMSCISADEVHPNIYGVQRIAEYLTDKIKKYL